MAGRPGRVESQQLAFRASATTAGLILFDSILDYLTSYVLGATEVRLAAGLRVRSSVVLEEGKVVEDGTHNEMPASGGRYTQLWHAQNNENRTSHPLDLTKTPSA